MRKLAEWRKGPIKFGILSTSQVLVVAALESPHQLHTRGDASRRWFLNPCSMGKALLAALPDEEVHSIVLDRGLARSTERTATMEPAFRRLSAQIRKNDHSVDWEQNEPGAMCRGQRFGHRVTCALGNQDHVAQRADNRAECCGAWGQSR